MKKIKERAEKWASETVVLTAPLKDRYEAYRRGRYEGFVAGVLTQAGEDLPFIREIIADLEENSYQWGGMADTMLRDWECELKKETVHLCDNCMNSFPECNGGPKFGNGYGDDNVYECDEFEEK
jgi:hypothetical protein